MIQLIVSLDARVIHEFKCLKCIAPFVCILFCRAFSYVSSVHLDMMIHDYTAYTSDITAIPAIPSIQAILHFTS